MVTVERHGAPTSPEAMPPNDRLEEIERGSPHIDREKLLGDLLEDARMNAGSRLEIYCTSSRNTRHEPEQHFIGEKPQHFSMVCCRAGKDLSATGSDGEDQSRKQEDEDGSQDEDMPPLKIVGNTHLRGSDNTSKEDQSRKQEDEDGSQDEDMPPLKIVGNTHLRGSDNTGKEEAHSSDSEEMPPIIQTRVSEIAKPITPTTEADSGDSDEMPPLAQKPAKLLAIMTSEESSVGEQQEMEVADRRKEDEANADESSSDDMPPLSQGANLVPKARIVASLVFNQSRTDEESDDEMPPCTQFFSAQRTNGKMACTVPQNLGSTQQQPVIVPEENGNEAIATPLVNVDRFQSIRILQRSQDHKEEEEDEDLHPLVSVKSAQDGESVDDDNMPPLINSSQQLAQVLKDWKLEQKQSVNSVHTVPAQPKRHQETSHCDYTSTQSGDGKSSPSQSTGRGQLQDYEIGDVVTLTNLTDAKLNGEAARVIKRHFLKQRVEVELYKTGQHLLVKHGNIMEPQLKESNTSITRYPEPSSSMLVQPRQEVCKGLFEGDYVELSGLQRRELNGCKAVVMGTLHIKKNKPNRRHGRISVWVSKYGCYLAISVGRLAAMRRIDKDEHDSTTENGDSGDSMPPLALAESAKNQACIPAAGQAFPMTNALALHEPRKFNVGQKVQLQNMYRTDFSGQVGVVLPADAVEGQESGHICVQLIASGKRLLVPTNHVTAYKSGGDTAVDERRGDLRPGASQSSSLSAVKRRRQRVIKRDREALAAITNDRDGQFQLATIESDPQSKRRVWTSSPPPDRRSSPPSDWRSSSRRSHPPVEGDKTSKISALRRAASSGEYTPASSRTIIGDGHRLSRSATSRNMSGKMHEDVPSSVVRWSRSSRKPEVEPANGSGRRHSFGVGGGSGGGRDRNRVWDYTWRDGDWYCAACEAHNFSLRETCFMCNAPKERERRPQRSPDAHGISKMNGRTERQAEHESGEKRALYIPPHQRRQEELRQQQQQQPDRLVDAVAPGPRHPDEATTRHSGNDTSQTTRSSSHKRASAAHDTSQISRPSSHRQEAAARGSSAARGYVSGNGARTSRPIALHAWCEENQLPRDIEERLLAEDVKEPSELACVADEDIVNFAAGLKLGPKGRFMSAVRRLRAELGVNPAPPCRSDL